MAEPFLNQGTGRVEHVMYLLSCVLFFLLPSTTSPSVIVGGLLLLLWLLSGRFYTGRSGYMGKDWVLPVFLLFLVPFLGLIYTPYPELGLKMSEKSYYWLFAFAIASLDISDRGRRIFVYSFLGGVGFSVSVSFLQHMGLVPLHRLSTATGFMNHINYGLLLVLAMTVLSFLFRKAGSKRHRIALGALMLIFMVSLSLSPSRAGFLAFLALSPLMLLNLFGKKNLVIIMAASAVLGASLFISPVVRDRVNKAIEETRGFDKQGVVGTSIGMRLMMWDGALRIFADNPVIGIGTGGYAREMEKYRRDKYLYTDTPGEIVHPHNSFLYMAVTYGTLGLLLFLWYLWVLLKKGWRHRDDVGGFTVLAFCLVFIVGSLTDTQILTYATGVLAALMTGLRME